MRKDFNSSEFVVVMVHPSRRRLTLSRGQTVAFPHDAGTMPGWARS